MSFYNQFLQCVRENEKILSIYLSIYLSNEFLFQKNKLKLVYRNICVQKEPSRGVLQESCSANMKKTPSRTTMCMRNLNKACNNTIHCYTPKTSQDIHRIFTYRRTYLKECFCMSTEF